MPKPCPVCGSRKWRRDNISGSAICEDGHVFQDFRSENLVVENSAYTLQKRALKKAPRRNRRRERGDVNRDHYRGDDAEYLKLQALQLLLRLQVSALSRLWSLPDAFETVVRDLWAYQLASVQIPPPPDPDTPSGDRKNGPSLNDNLTGSAFDDEELKSVHYEGSGESSESEQSTPDDVALEEELMARLSPNTSDDEAMQQVQGEASTASDVRWRRRRRIQITDTLVTLVVALWVLRIPVLNVDLERLVNDNRLPFLDLGHTTLVPAEMKKHMDREAAYALSPKAAPRPEFLHEQCSIFVRILTLHFRVTIPEANIVPTAWRIIPSIGGTPTTYAQVMRLLEVLDVNLTLTATHTQTISRKVSRRRSARSLSRPPSRGPVEEKTIERTSRYEDVWLPEVSVAAALIMVMKMAYGLDGINRPALTWSDPVIGLQRPGSWIQYLSERLDTDSSGSRPHLQRQDFASMQVEDIDRYLDRCERILLRDQDTGIDPTFPLAETHREDDYTSSDLRRSYAHWTKADLVQPSTRSLNVPNKELPPLPGERMRMYDSTDLTGTLPAEYDTLLKSCAAVVGVEEKHLARCVEVYETRLEKIRLHRGELRRESSLSRSVSRTNSGAGRGRRPKSMGNIRDSARPGIDTPPATS